MTNTFEASVETGHERLNRSWPGLLATGAVGGIDVSIGLLALLTVQHATGNRLLAALAFGIGFVALTLANSELFTENFLVPSTPWWPVTPRSGRETALETGSHVMERGLDQSLLAAAVLGGTIITLMTWMERGTPSMPAKLVAAMSAAFLLGSGVVVHAVVNTLEMFAALHVGASFGYLQVAKMLRS